MKIVNISLCIIFCFLVACSVSKKEERKNMLLKGEKIYHSLLPKKYLQSFSDTTDYLLNEYDFLNECEKLYCAYYAVHSAFVEKKPYKVKFVYSLAGDMKFKTNIFRGSFGFEGVSYTKQNAEKDLRDWKRVLKCD